MEFAGALDPAASGAPQPLLLAREWAALRASR